VKHKLKELTEQFFQNITGQNGVPDIRDSPFVDDPRSIQVEPHLVLVLVTTTPCPATARPQERQQPRTSL